MVTLELTRKATRLGGFFIGCFELNDTNEMCLKTEDFL